MWFSKPDEAKNQDGGPKTHLFAFSLERERQTAKRLLRGNAPELLQARYRLIGAVHQYRLTGVATDELYAAALAELELAPRNRRFLNVSSTGIKRLAELAADGHERAADLVRAQFDHARAERRVTAYENALGLWLDRAQRISVCRRMLDDPSGDVRQIAASQIEYDGLIEMADLAEDAAAGRIGNRAASRIRYSTFCLRERHRLGLGPRERLPDASWERWDAMNSHG